MSRRREVSDGGVVHTARDPRIVTCGKVPTGGGNDRTRRSPGPKDGERADSSVPEPPADGSVGARTELGDDSCVRGADGRFGGRFRRRLGGLRGDLVAVGGEHLEFGQGVTVTEPGDGEGVTVVFGGQAFRAGRFEAASERIACACLLAQCRQVVVGSIVRVDVGSPYDVQAGVGRASGQADVDAGPGGFLGGQHAPGPVRLALGGVGGEGVGVGESAHHSGSNLPPVRARAVAMSCAPDAGS
jgi:hypothetical protein